MAEVLESLHIPRGWSKSYIHQLAEYVRYRDIAGYYYGNREQFEKRHKEILEWIENYEDEVYGEDAPKFVRKKK